MVAMRRMALGLSLALATAATLAGCADPERATDHPANAGDVFVAVTGTPVLIATKIPLCAATAAMAGPIAGITALSDGGDARDAERGLGDAVDRNCGTPWRLTP